MRDPAEEYPETTKADEARRIAAQKPAEPAEKDYRFVAEAHGNRFLAIGYVDGGDVFCDGAIVEDRVLAERIALNMEAAFRAGVKYATTRMIDNATKTRKYVDPYH